MIKSENISMYKIYYHPRVFKFIKKLPKQIAHNIVIHIDKFQDSPFSGELDIKKLKNTKQCYRLRIQTIRIIYEIDIKNKTIYIHDIGFRGNIY